MTRQDSQAFRGKMMFMDVRAVVRGADIICEVNGTCTAGAVVVAGSCGGSSNLFGGNDATTMHRSGCSVVGFHDGDITKGRKVHDAPRRCTVINRCLLIGR
jgi:hypothetical protein